jgi:REP element-mobilizing transposase RayT
MEPLQPGFYYHIYNHANGSENLFLNEDNYNFFLKKYSSYIRPVADTFAYCLMPNHIHVLVRIKEINEKTSEVFKTSDVLNLRRTEKLR